MQKIYSNPNFDVVATHILKKQHTPITRLQPSPPNPVQLSTQSHSANVLHRNGIPAAWVCRIHSSWRCWFLLHWMLIGRKEGIGTKPRIQVGIGTGNPGVFQGYPHLYPSKPIPVGMGTGFPKTWGHQEKAT